jgi:hypothetical protein
MLDYKCSEALNAKGNQMHAHKTRRVEMVNGKELRVQRERNSEFWAWQREDGVWVQSTDNRSKLWESKGVPFIKVSSCLLSYKDVIPGTDDNKDMVRMTLVGKREHCDNYLSPKLASMNVQYNDEAQKHATFVSKLVHVRPHF